MVVVLLGRRGNKRVKVVGDGPADKFATLGVFRRGTYTSILLPLLIRSGGQHITRTKGKKKGHIMRSIDDFHDNTITLDSARRRLMNGHCMPWMDYSYYFC